MVDTSHLSFDWHQIEKMAKGLAARYAQNQDEWEDLVQDYRIRALEIIRDGKPHPISYFGRAFINRGIDVCKSRRRRRTCSLEEAIKGGAFGSETFSAEDLQVDPEADDRITELIYRVTLDPAVSALGGIYQEVFCLFVFDNLPYEQIAEVLGIPTGTVRSRLHRARRAVLEAGIMAGVA